MEKYVGYFGVIVFLAVAFAFSSNKKKVKPRTIIMGLMLQVILGLILLKFEYTARAFRVFTTKVAEFLALSIEGADFVFGPLAHKDIMAHTDGLGFIFAVQVIPTIIFFSAFISVMYYLGVVQVVIRGVAWVMRKTMQTSGAETLSCAGNIFVGQTEAPFLIRPFLNRMTFSELNAVMTGGFATVAGGVLAIYIGMGVPAHHLIVASVMAAPGALLMAKLLIPETEHSETAGDTPMPDVHVGDNVIDAAARGTTDGLNLALNVVAMLISFIALIAVVNWVLGGLDYLIDGKFFGNELGPGGHYDGIFPGELKTIFGKIFAPIAFLMGVPVKDVADVGNFLGIKITINEMVAYSDLAEAIRQRDLLVMLVEDAASVTREQMEATLNAVQLAAVDRMMANQGAITEGILKHAISQRAIDISTYALCGFANFASIGIQIGGIGALAPERRTELAKLGLRAMVGGATVSLVTATIAGLILAF